MAERSSRQADAASGNGSGRFNEQIKKRVEEALLTHFRPEFINRVDEIVIFNVLGREEIAKIVELQVARVAKLLEDRKIEINLSEAAKDLLLTQGYDPQYGARPVKRTVQRRLQDPLAMRILDGDVVPGDRVRVDVDRDGREMIFERDGDAVPSEKAGKKR